MRKFLILFIFFTLPLSAQEAQEYEFKIGRYSTSPDLYRLILNLVVFEDTPTARCEALDGAAPFNVPFPTATDNDAYFEALSWTGGGSASSCRFEGNFYNGDGSLRSTSPQTLYYDYELAQEPAPLCPDGFCSVFFWGDLRFGVDGKVLTESEFQTIDGVCSALEGFNIFEFNPVGGDRIYYHEFRDWLGTGQFTSDSSGYCSFDVLTYNIDKATNTPSYATSPKPSVLNFSLEMPDEPDPEEPCSAIDTEYCCVQHAENSCSAYGGLYSYTFGGSPTLPTASCSFFCMDDVTPTYPFPDNPDLPDYRPHLISIETSLDTISTILNRDLSDIKDLLGNLDNVPYDDSEVVSYLSQVDESLDTLVASAISTEDLDGLFNEYFSDLDFADIEFTGNVNVDGIGELNSSVDSIDGFFRNLFSGFDSFQDSDLDVYYNNDPFLNAAGETDSDAIASYLEGINQEQGLNYNEDDFEELFRQDVIDLDQIQSQYDFSYGPATCPAPINLTILSRDFTFSFEPFCDLAQQIAPMIVFSAWFMSPFIAFGLSRK